jgi:hypothetical protein
MMNTIAPYAEVVFKTLFGVIQKQSKHFANYHHPDFLLLQTYKDGLLNQHYATYMSQTGTWASCIEAQAAAD